MTTLGRLPEARAGLQRLRTLRAEAACKTTTAAEPCLDAVIEFGIAKRAGELQQARDWISRCPDAGLKL